MRSGRRCFGVGEILSWNLGQHKKVFDSRRDAMASMFADSSPLFTPWQARFRTRGVLAVLEFRSLLLFAVLSSRGRMPVSAAFGLST